MARFPYIALLVSASLFPTLPTPSPSQHSRPLNRSVAWTPPKTDSAVPGLSDTPACSLPAVLNQVQSRAVELVANLEKFDATEISRAAVSDFSTNNYSMFEARFDFMAQFAVENGHLTLTESRQGSDQKQSPTAKYEDTGIPALALIFHPIYAADFTFECAGAAAWNGNPAWVISFHQKDGARSRLMAFRSKKGNMGAKLKGRAWIARDSGQVMHLEINLIEPIKAIALMANAVSIDYAPVQFHSANVQLWLPETAVTYSQFEMYRVVKRHTYTDFQLFSVGTQSVIGKPKIPTAQQGDASAPATPTHEPAPAPNDKPAKPATPKR